MKNIWKYTSVLCVGICVLLSSCADGLLVDTNPISALEKSEENSEFTILAAKQWYENIQVPEITNNFAGGEEGEKIYPYWDMAIINTKGRFEAVEVPIIVKKRYICVDSLTYQKWDMDIKTDYILAVKVVVLKDNETNRIRSFIMEIVGTYEYMRKGTIYKNNYFFRDPELEGVVMFYTLKGKFINGWRYAGGKIVKKILP